MRRKRLIYLLTFSLALNGATAIAFVFFWWQSRTPAEASVKQISIKSFVQEDLNLTIEQSSPLLALIDAGKKEIENLRAQIESRRTEMMVLISSFPVNRDAVDGKMEEIGRIQSKMRSTTLNTVMKVLESLPPDSRAKFGAYLRARGRACDENCPPTSEVGKAILGPESKGDVKEGGGR